MKPSSRQSAMILLAAMTGMFLNTHAFGQRHQQEKHRNHRYRHFSYNNAWKQRSYYDKQRYYHYGKKNKGYHGSRTSKRWYGGGYNHRPYGHKKSYGTFYRNSPKYYQRGNSYNNAARR